MMIWIICGLLVTGALFAVAMSKVLQSRSVDGCLRIDRSDPDEPPYLFLELTGNVSEIGKKKYVRFEVCEKNFISHE